MPDTDVTKKPKPFIFRAKEFFASRLILILNWQQCDGKRWVKLQLQSCVFQSRVLHESTTNTRSHVMLTYATFGLAFLQPLLNPIVYISTNVRYKKELLVREPQRQ